ncbi:MAG: hypothetical protein U0V64_04745 [Cyclobacteriaceae bacterium]
MKKIVALLMVVSLLVGGCSAYTCPTYAKKTSPQHTQASRI